ncbi:Uncharacterised protein [Vibrio cholerae]|nr:Uncharacterised protein [Vibrio cholerae]CSI39111.1 Uncharacterised protein [Vibrio cholerae]CSI61774.1 Uncharacterised protein [Vibrio cholerae]
MKLVTFRAIRCSLAAKFANRSRNTTRLGKPVRRSRR